MSLSLSEYARHRRDTGLVGCTLRSVQEARDAGRLAGALTKGGRIKSAELADAAWDGTTLEDRVPLSGPAATGKPSRMPSRLQELRIQREAIRIEREQLELDKEKGMYVLVDQAQRDLRGLIVIMRNHFLGIPSKIAQRLPKNDVARQVYSIVEDLIRQGLEDYADGKVAGMRADGEVDP